MSLNADDDSGPEAEPDYNEEEPPPDPSSGNCSIFVHYFWLSFSQLCVGTISTCIVNLPPI